MRAIINSLLFALMVFLGVVFGTLCGAFSGWCIGLLFGKTILSFLAALGITGFKMWQIGAVLGFVGGFFKSFNVKFNNVPS